MSEFNETLANLISKATKEYENVAKNDPVIESIDDNTTRGDVLDVIIDTQTQEKRELWDKLYQVNVLNFISSFVFNCIYFSFKNNERKKATMLYLQRRRNLHQIVNNCYY
jgi:hypothetical protein